MEKFELIETDVLIIGAGGTGLRAAIEAAKYNLDVSVVGKELLGKAHTTMAEGGINAALGNVDPEDNWKWHFLDTVEGGAWLNDQDLAEVLVKEAPDRIFDLEEFGAIFDRLPDGKIAQRPFGKARYRRTCYMSDYTGHEVLATLVDETRKRGVNVFEEIFVSKLLTSNGKVTGAIAIDMKNGDFLVFKAKAIVLSTGGAGRMYKVTTNPASATGDGKILALNAGAEVMDMEMFQFHPTTMVWPPSCRGILVTEAVRGEGGILLNAKGERFMKRYNPKLMELAGRDAVARANWTEIMEGRGTEHGGVYLSVTQLDPELVKTRLKTMYKQFLLAGVDITKEPMEVSPGAHYYMGGVRILSVTTETCVKGLFAGGEETAGVHGANRLGGNSLIDTQVFGKRAGEYAAKFAKSGTFNSIDFKQVEEEQKRILLIAKEKYDKIRPVKIREQLSEVMWENAGIFRDEEKLNKALTFIEKVKKEQLPKLGICDTTTLRYNKELVEALEAINLVRTAELLVRSALIRMESRGAHYRTDYPQTDNKNWLKHIVWRLENGVLKYRFEPVKIMVQNPP